MKGGIRMFDENELKKACEKYDVTYEERFGTIYLNTGCEKFFFEPSNGKIKLVHIDNMSSRGCGFHTQFNKHIEMYELVRYVRRHTNKKFGIKKSSKIKDLVYKENAS